jgi:hypothetical protein
MTVVEAGHARFAAFMWTVNFYRCHCHFLREKCGDESFIYFLLINDWIQEHWVVLQPILKIVSCFAPNLTPVCERCVLTYSHHFDVFYMERQP